jgi:g-D-glutamyl-meso-diaminopimelate peptidase
LKKQKEKTKQDKKEKKSQKFPRWAIIVLCVGWGLFLLLLIFACVWQFGDLAEQKRIKEGIFLEGETVDVTDSLYTYEDMWEDLLALERDYPDRIRVASAGKTADGREILYADLGNPNAPNQILVSAGLHGREYLNSQVLMKLVEYALVNYEIPYENGVSFGRMADRYMIRVVPMANPDGVCISQFGMDGLRNEELKTIVKGIFEVDYGEYQSYRDSYDSMEEYLKHWKANAEGVDLNRNFPIDEWDKMTTGIGHPSSQKYKGPSAASAAETETLMRLLGELSSPICQVSLHSQGEILYWDCGQTGDLRRKNLALAEALAKMTGYRTVNTFSSPDATLEDYAALKLGIPSVNIETGTGSCPLPHEQFEVIYGKTEKLFWTLFDFCETNAQ